jgi:CRP-like cAMP-binding protein
LAALPSDRLQNRLLAALPQAEFERVQPHLHTITVKAKQVVHRQGEPFDYVCFLNGGVLSMVTAFADGNRVESATIGREGMVGMAAFLTDLLSGGARTDPASSARNRPSISCRHQ